MIPFPITAFLQSSAQVTQFPPDEGIEFAFAGRSNAGKSSAINAITGSKGLARTSKTPGRTQLINFFTIDDQRRLVDLPGYGYAKVSIAIKSRWQKLLADYLAQRQSLGGLILIMDIRHPLKEFDQHMLTFAQQRQLPTHILLSKADKLSRSAALHTLQQVTKALPDLHAASTLQLFSAHKGVGLLTARKHLLARLFSH
jgi:GTP-binding protein